MLKSIHKWLLGEPYTTRYTLQVSDPANQPRRPVRIALLADLHDCMLGKDYDTLLAAIEREQTDIVVCAGDMVTAKAGFGHANHSLHLLRLLSARYPVYLADGNHETRLRLWQEKYPGMYRKYLKELAEMGAVLLNNRSRIVKIAGMRICISGYVQRLGVYDRVHPGRVSAQELQSNLGEPSGKYYDLLIAHAPDHFQAYADWGADLTVAGHLHGGIIRIPGLGGLLGSTLRPFPKYDKGLFTHKGADGREHAMVVSAGLGSHSIAFRVNNPPELVIIELEGKS